MHGFARLHADHVLVLTFGVRVIGIVLASEWLDHRFDPASPSQAKVDAMCAYE